MFIAVYLDEDVNVLVGQLLAHRGYRAITARDAGQLSRSDPEQLAFATNRGMVIVSHNRGDFEELHRQYIAAGRDHTGIILAVRRGPYGIACHLLPILNRVTADEMRNQLLYI